METRTYSLKEVTEAAGIYPGMYCWHRQSGANVPLPSVRVGRRMRFTEADKDKVVAWYAGREKFDRLPKDGGYPAIKGKAEVVIKVNGVEMTEADYALWSLRQRNNINRENQG